MELELRIKSILQMDKFNNLSEEEKDFVFQSIFANCLIMSKENQDRFLDVITNRLAEIINLKDKSYYKNGICYNGIVETLTTGKTLDVDQTLFLVKYSLKYKEINTPLGRMTKSILHEFGHLAVKKGYIKLDDNSYYIDMGGLVVSKLLKVQFGHMLSEIINEFTTYLSYKAFLSYSPPDEERIKAMKSFAEQNGFSVEDNNKLSNILPNNLFTSYLEEYLSTCTLDEGTKEMFNPRYDKYTPLVRLMMFAFQNPLYSYEDLKLSFEKGDGLSGKINDIPINDLFYSYYEDSFYALKLFDTTLSENGAWEKFCLEFDSKMMDEKIDKDFILNSVQLLSNFYSRRLKQMTESGLLTTEYLKQKEKEFSKISGSCIAYYDAIKDKKF